MESKVSYITPVYEHVKSIHEDLIREQLKANDIAQELLRALKALYDAQQRTSHLGKGFARMAHGFWKAQEHDLKHAASISLELCNVLNEKTAQIEKFVKEIEQDILPKAEVVHGAGLDSHE